VLILAKSIEFAPFAGALIAEADGGETRLEVYTRLDYSGCQWL
jgi:hypothetical protein